jgi:hypothetical protein
MLSGTFPAGFLSRRKSRCVETSHLLSFYRSLTVALGFRFATAWQALVMLSLQALWAVVFVLFGKSMVTGAQSSFHLHHDRV